MTPVQAARAIVAHHMEGTALPAELIGPSDYPLIDPQTANAIVTVYDGLKKQSNKDKFDRMELTRAGLFAWELIGKLEEGK